MPLRAHIADETHRRLAFDGADQLVGKTFERCERLIEYYSREFPMPGGGVFAGGPLSHPSITAPEVTNILAQSSTIQPALTKRDSASVSRDACSKICPSVLAPSSPYSAASGAPPMPALSRTMTSARTAPQRPIGCQAVFISTVSRIQYGSSAALVRYAAGVRSRRT